MCENKGLLRQRMQMICKRIYHSKLNHMLRGDQGVDVSKQSDHAPGSYMEANAGSLLRGRGCQVSEPVWLHPIL